MKKILILFSLVVFSCFTINAINENGVWHRAEDVRGGLFGGDEGVISNYSFNTDVHFKQVISWENGVNRITYNDGGGNVQIRFGHDFSNSDERFTHTGTAFYVGGNQDLATGSLYLKVASNGGAGVDQPVTWGTPLIIGKDTLTFDNNVFAKAYYHTSDKRLKENIQTIENPIELVKQLEGVSFDWKDSKESEIGLIAQDVEKIVPEIVGTRDDGYKSVQYANLVAILIEAVKEQQKQIDELRLKCE